MEEDKLVIEALVLALTGKRRDLDLVGLNIGDVTAIAIANAETALKELRLCCNNIGPIGGRALAGNVGITCLDLAGNNIGDRGAEAFGVNKILRRLNLNCNNIGPSGALALAGNETIEVLDLCGNFIGPEGAAALAHNCTIKELNLSGNAIGNAGATALAGNRSLLKLNIADNDLGDDAAVAIATNTKLIHIDLNGNRIGDRGVAALTAMKAERPDVQLIGVNLSKRHLQNVGRRLLMQSANSLGARGATGGKGIG